MKSPAVTRIVRGLGLAVVGAVGTGASYLYAALQEGVGTYYVFHGLVLVGVLYAGSGLLQLVGYSPARQSSDPWVRAEHDEAALHALLAETIVSPDAGQRAQAAARLWKLGLATRPPDALPRLYAHLLVDDVSAVRHAAGRSLRRLALDDEAKTRRLLGAVLQTVEGSYRDHPISGAVVAALRPLVADREAFLRWRVTRDG